ARDVQREPGARRLELRVMLGEPHQGRFAVAIGVDAILLVEDAIGAPVGLELVRDHRERRAVVTTRRRPHALGPTAERVDLGLVYRAPPLHLAAEFARAETHVLPIPVHRFATLPTPAS